MELYRQLGSFIKEIAPSWRKSQQAGLALLAQALFSRRSLVLTELARAYPIPVVRKVKSPKHGLLHRVKRLWRFLHNPRVDMHDLFRRLTVLSYSVCGSPGLLLPILVDLSYFEPFAALSANVPRAGRALPIAWRVFARDLDGVADLSQPLLIQRLIWVSASPSPRWRGSSSAASEEGSSRPFGSSALVGCCMPSPLLFAGRDWRSRGLGHG